MKITMAHGSGGFETGELIATVFQPYFANEYLDKLGDAAQLPPDLALTTDSFVVDPPFFPGGDIGKLAVCGTLNDLWMAGAKPAFLSAAFILQEGLEIEDLRRIAQSLGETARANGVPVVCGDTKVVEAGGASRGQIFINTTGLGYRCYAQTPGTGQVKVGDAVLVSGPLGRHHAAIMATRLGIETEITSDCACLGPLVEPLWRSGLTLHMLRDITRGGLATVLGEVSRGSGCNIELEETAIPVTPAVRSLAGLLGLDPLYMANEGTCAIILPAAEATAALDLLRSLPGGEGAVRVGKVKRAVPPNSPRVLLRTTAGGRRLLDILYGEGLPRIC
jgi:hydrogenase expression/formation protein HypE